MGSKQYPANLHLEALLTFSKVSDFQCMDAVKLKFAKEIARLIPGTKDEIHARRFDALICNFELSTVLAQVAKKSDDRTAAMRTIAACQNKITKIANALLKIPNIREIDEKRSVLEHCMEDWPELMFISEQENLRENLRDLMKYLPKEVTSTVMTDFQDELINLGTIGSETPLPDSPIPYKQRVEQYIQQHRKDGVVAKLYTNQPLTFADVKEFERILWAELGTSNEFADTFGSGEMNFGEFVRRQIGMDREAVNAAFSQFMIGKNLSTQQSVFIKRIIDFVSVNGIIERADLIEQQQFSNFNIGEIFSDQKEWLSVLNTIESFKKNARCVLQINQ